MHCVSGRSHGPSAKNRKEPPAFSTRQTIANQSLSRRITFRKWHSYRALYRLGDLTWGSLRNANFPPKLSNGVPSGLHRIFGNVQ
jgi:hypothetical protein